LSARSQAFLKFVVEQSRGREVAWLSDF